MENKQPIDKLRELGGFAEIGNQNEGTITEMFGLDNKLIIIKEKAIYEFVLADTIDPTRRNPDLPKSIQKLIINQGSDSELVARTFLTAKGLLKPQFLPDHIKVESAILVTLELLQELATLDSEIKDFLEKEKEVIAEYRAQKKKQESYVIPSVTDVLTRCKTIFQKSDHIYQVFVEIINIFYPDEGLNKQSHITTIYEFIKSKYGESDPFSRFIKDNIHFFETIRDIRDCLDHRLSNIKIMNFELHISSCVITPTIEMDFRGVKLERQSLSSLLPYIYKTLIKLFESTIVYLCDKNAKQNLLQYRVTFIPLERRINKLINHSFWSPIGKGGYFYL